MRLMIIGCARWGKDTVADILHRAYGLTHVSSSYFCAEIAVRPYLAKKGIVYGSLDECYNDRVNHRADWFNAINEYNSPDRTRLTRALFNVYDIYCGIRNHEEIEAVIEKGLTDLIVWIDASKRVEVEDKTSCTVTSDHADLIIDNNGSLEELEHRVRRIFDQILGGNFSTPNKQ